MRTTSSPAQWLNAGDSSRYEDGQKKEPAQIIATSFYLLLQHAKDQHKIQMPDTPLETGSGMAQEF